MIKPIHLTEGNFGIRKDIHIPSSIKYRTIEYFNTIMSIINPLDVRYKNNNVLMYDLCYFNDAYIPLIWWTSDSIESLIKDEDPKELRLMNCVDQLEWLHTYGSYFNWEKSKIEDSQLIINSYKDIGLIFIEKKTGWQSAYLLPSSVQFDTEFVPLILNNKGIKRFHKFQKYNHIIFINKTIIK